MRLRVLPGDPFAKLAYVWLMYLASPLWFAWVGRVEHPTTAVLTLVAIVAFLPLYFWAYWLEGWRELYPIVGMVALGVVTAPSNPGGCVFFVYAATFAQRVGPRRTAVTILFGVCIVIALDSVLLGLATQSAVWSVIVSSVIGGMVIYSSRVAKDARDQVRHLAVINERERIGRDLHDVLGHTLSVIALKAELASKLAHRDPERSLAEIRDVERISREALGQVRQAVQASRPSSIAEELRNAERALKAAGIALQVSTEPTALDNPGEQALALSIREAITNVIRHSSATRCSVRIDRDLSLVRLTIDDDGVGRVEEHGAGLTGMRARVLAIGGEFEITCSNGTRIEIAIPTPPGMSVGVGALA